MTNRPAQKVGRKEGELQERRTVGGGAGKVLTGITVKKEGREGGWAEDEEQRGEDDK